MLDASGPPTTEHPARFPMVGNVEAGAYCHAHSSPWDRDAATCGSWCVSLLYVSCRDVWPLNLQQHKVDHQARLGQETTQQIAA